jgi:hypothetical protein
LGVSLRRLVIGTASLASAERRLANDFGAP